MNEVLNGLAEKYNILASELYEEVLCDKCMRSIKVGNAESKLVNLLNNEIMFLCKKCNEEVRNSIKKL
jgi:RNase P subunit RPR2